MTSPFSLDAATGLRWEDVARKKAQGKQNTLPEKVTKSAGQILKDNICTLFNLFNVLIALALALVGAWSNMLFILVIALNTVIGIVQEFHAKKLVEDLSLLAMPTAQVVREGTLTELPLQELVEGDVVQLETGRQVCADGVTITGAVEGQDFCLTVDDDGPGMPPEALPRLFDVFYRNDPARKNPDQGSGLGLAIVAKSMERMGGTIRAENRPQGGLRMVLRIPQTEGEMDHETHPDR